MKVFRLATGFAVGYVLGSRAGRDKYEQIVATARKVQNHPAVTQVQDKAKQLLSIGAASATDADPELTTTSTSAVSDPAPRSSRRQPPKSSVAVPDVAIDPLT